MTLRICWALDFLCGWRRFGSFPARHNRYLGSAIYHRDDFAIGSLPAPDEAEFDELVGPADQFAYVDENGGRHVFSAQVEHALKAWRLPDGIAVLDEGHPRDLPALVEKALMLMLGEQAAGRSSRKPPAAMLQPRSAPACASSWKRITSPTGISSGTASARSTGRSRAANALMALCSSTKKSRTILSTPSSASPI